MLDVMKIGGVTGWLRAAALAEAKGLQVSSHLFPEISAHLLAATPTAHWLEYQDWVDPILQQPAKPRDGHITPSTPPGCGLDWDESAVLKYFVR
jgi:mandelate racemase